MLGPEPVQRLRHHDVRPDPADHHPVPEHSADDHPAHHPAGLDDAAGHRPGDAQGGADTGRRRPGAPQAGAGHFYAGQARPKKKQSKPKRRSNIAHTASVSTRNCKTSKSGTAKKGAKRAICATAVTTSQRHPARRR